MVSGNSPSNGYIYGHGAPTSKPNFIGEQYLDLDNEYVYIAFGNSAVSDWKIINQDNDNGIKTVEWYENGGLNRGANALCVSRYLIPTDCNITRVGAHDNGSSVGTNVKFCVYSDSSGTPDTLLAETEEITLTSDDNRMLIIGDLDSPLSASKDTAYWFGLLADATFQTIGYTDGVTAEIAKYMAVTYANGFPTSFSVTGSTQPVRHTII